MRKDRGLNILQYEKQTRLINSSLDGQEMREGQPSFNSFTPTTADRRVLFWVSDPQNRQLAGALVQLWSPEQPFGSLTLLAVFELTVTLLVKIIKYEGRLMFVLLIYAKKRNGHSEKFWENRALTFQFIHWKCTHQLGRSAIVVINESLNFLGFSAEELDQARENFVRGSRDTDSDLPIEDYTSNKEEPSDSDASLTDEDRPLPQDWTDQLTPSVIEDFVDNAGRTTILSGHKREMDFFQLLFQENLFSLIVKETNKHADQTQQKKGQNDNKWHRTRKKSVHLLEWEFTWA